MKPHADISSAHFQTQCTPCQTLVMAASYIPTPCNMQCSDLFIEKGSLQSQQVLLVGCVSMQKQLAACCTPVAGSLILRIEHGKPHDVPSFETDLTKQIVLVQYPKKNVSDTTLTYITK